MEMFKSEMDDLILLKNATINTQHRTGGSINRRKHTMKINAEVFGSMFERIGLPFVPETWEERAWFLTCLFVYREERSLISQSEKKAYRHMFDRLRGRMLARAVWRLYDPEMFGNVWGETSAFELSTYGDCTTTAESAPWERRPIAHMHLFIDENPYWYALIGEGRNYQLPEGDDIHEFCMTEEKGRSSDGWDEWPSELSVVGLFLWASGVLRWTGDEYRRNEEDYLAGRKPWWQV